MPGTGLARSARVVDIPRTDASRRSKRTRLWLAVAGVLGLVAVLMFTVGFTPPAKQVSRGAIYTAKVERGAMARTAHGPGTLVPKDIRWVTATSTGQVQRILVEPGATVEADTIIIELSNPDMELQELEAQAELARAEAELVSLRARLETEQLTLGSNLAGLEADDARHSRAVDKDQALWDQGAVTEDQLAQSREQARRTQRQAEYGRRQLTVLERSRKSQLEAQTATVARLAAVAEFRHAQVAKLSVTAGAAGVLREITLEEGQWVTPGTVMAKVIKPGKLAAELRIPEAQATELAVGQTATIDTHEALVEAVVTRVNPAVEGGSVEVELALVGELPGGARPDLSITGEIEIARLPDVLHVARPVGAPANGSFAVFRLDSNGGAEQVSVRFGQASVDRIEVLAGLEPGDQIIISDTSAWSEEPRLQIQD
jgi:HlyD family secretion protein